MNKEFLKAAVLILCFTHAGNSLASSCYGENTIYTENFTGNLITARVSQSCTCGSATVGFEYLATNKAHGGSFQIDEGSFPSICNLSPSYVTITYSIDGKDIGWSTFYKNLGGNKYPCNHSVSIDSRYSVTCLVYENTKNKSTSRVAINKI